MWEPVCCTAIEKHEFRKRNVALSHLSFLRSDCLLSQPIEEAPRYLGSAKWFANCSARGLELQPILPGAVINVRPIGVLGMDDEGVGDEKIVAMPVADVPLCVVSSHQNGLSACSTAL